jgi:hypothetical protein
MVDHSTPGRKSAPKERGSRDGLIFNASKNPANKLDYVTVEYAGSTKSDATNAGVKAIAER